MITRKYGRRTVGFIADSLQREGAAEAKFLPTSIIYKNNIKILLMIKIYLCIYFNNNQLIYNCILLIIIINQYTKVYY